MNAHEFAEQNAEAIRFTVARLTDSGNGGPFGKSKRTKREAWVRAVFFAAWKAGWELKPRRAAPALDPEQ